MVVVYNPTGLCPLWSGLGPRKRLSGVWFENLSARGNKRYGVFRPCTARTKMATKLSECRERRAATNNEAGGNTARFTSKPKSILSNSDALG
jgi:hypothetical protein